MTVSLTENERLLLLEMLNEARVPGRIAEMIVDLKRKLSAPSGNPSPPAQSSDE